MLRLFRLIAFALAAAIGLHGLAAKAADEPAWVHAIAMYGEPKYPPGFTHFDYVNPAAPKGGEIRTWELDTFDNLHPLVQKGVPAAGTDRSWR